MHKCFINRLISFIIRNMTEYNSFTHSKIYAILGCSSCTSSSSEKRKSSTPCGLSLKITFLIFLKLLSLPESDAGLYILIRNRSEKISCLRILRTLKVLNQWLSTSLGLMLLETPGLSPPPPPYNISVWAILT